MPSRLPGEFKLIEQLTSRLPQKISGADFQIAIGDDAAVRKRGPRYELLTHDLLLEGVHFLRGGLKDFRDLGWKALAVNLSDIAAMGGRPEQALVGLGIPPGARVSELKAFYQGLGDCARAYGCAITGGDTNRSRSDWAVAITVLGLSARRPILRSGAQAGDGLWVSGTLGDAALGWQARQRGLRSQAFRPFLARHARPEPRLDWARSLAEGRWLSSMLDLSDGLGGDLQHLARASQVGFEVDLDLLPRAQHFTALCARLKLDPIDILLNGGEDYELCFTVKASRERAFGAWLAEAGLPFSRIGRAVPRPGIRYNRGGRIAAVAATGFRHF